MAARYPHSNMSAVDLADHYALTGSNGRALAWLERAYHARAFALFTIRFDKTIPSTLFEEAGWQELWQESLFIGGPHMKRFATELASGK